LRDLELSLMNFATLAAAWPHGGKIGFMASVFSIWRTGSNAAHRASVWTGLNRFG